jgi:hypothetical protein
LRDGNISLRVSVDVLSAPPAVLSAPILTRPRGLLVAHDARPVVVAVFPSVIARGDGSVTTITLLGLNFDDRVNVTFGGGPAVIGNVTRGAVVPERAVIARLVAGTSSVSTVSATTVRRQQQNVDVDAFQSGKSDHSDLSPVDSNLEHDHHHHHRAHSKLLVQEEKTADFSSILAAGGSMWSGGGPKVLDAVVLDIVSPPGATTDVYETLTLANVDTGSRLAIGDLLFLTEDCPLPGTFGKNGKCKDCPAKGAECPGGNRIWPLSGYWNPGEDSGYVVECQPSQRCIGGQLSQCAIGHHGDLCATCIDGFVSLRGLCIPCPSQPSVVAYIIGDAVVWGTVAGSAWFLKSMHDFQRVVAFVSVLQTAGQFTALLTSKMPQFVLQIYDVMDIFLGDYEIFKADCLGHTPTFATKYLSNIVYNFLIGAFMSFGTIVVGLVWQRIASQRRAHIQEFYSDRFRCTITVWAQLIYVNLTRRAFEAVYCTPRPDGTYYLQHFPAVQCFTGMHILFFSLSLLLLVGLTIGWPLWYTWFLWNKSEATLCSPRFQHRWGTHFVLLKPERRVFFLSTYVMGICLAIAEVFASTSTETRVAIGGTAIFVHIAAVFRLGPHIVPRDDWVLMSYEFPMLMLLGIGAAAELGTVSEETLTIVSLITLALLAGCILFHFGDLLYHVFRRSTNMDDAVSAVVDEGSELDVISVTVCGSDPGKDSSESSAGNDPTQDLKLTEEDKISADVMEGSRHTETEKTTSVDVFEKMEVVNPQPREDDSQVAAIEQGPEEEVGLLMSLWNMLPIFSARATLPQSDT